MMLGQQSDGFGVGFGDEFHAMPGQFRAQITEVFDDAVVHHRNRACTMGMGVVDGRRAMGGPACMADASLAGQWFMDQQIAEVDQLADGPTAGQGAVIHRGDTSAVIAAIFKPLERLYKQRCRFVVAKYPYNSAHF